MYSNKVVDYGTPKRQSENTVTVHVDGKPVCVPEGTSVMRAATEAGVNVPKLCATDSLESFGSCRLCLVEIDGRRGTPASCTTPCEDGMQVTTQSKKLADLRRGVMELYISDHPLDCLTCPANGNCELQDMAGAVGLRDVRYGYEGDNHLTQDTDGSNVKYGFESLIAEIYNLYSFKKADSECKQIQKGEGIKKGGFFLILFSFKLLFYYSI